ncbi:VPLPA-CTERM sorting domain-containing protein [Methylomonas sp. LL1]|uniref:VPLPA-CTERM sorting domain-containing protein n=1 Tax=Methylomonas sp. LL1 TaxID=2785785 RepID=UPI0018C3993A|nr:VPLPA-CTERM sorting domain-containing protein [Methylomonas sp. LL1]QPK65108.1 VPLPA-CTERM sorting domain-containing protein [Methylomonas sp. LL1]
MKIFNAIVMAGTLAFTNAQAATVSGGSLILNIDRDALAAGVTMDNTPAPSIYVEEFFGASAASKTQSQLLNDNTPADWSDYAANEIPATGLQYAVNGLNIDANPAGRENRPTTFEFNPGDLLGSATGNIGLGGVIRFRVDVNRSNNRIVMGDMTLEYHPELEAATPGRSGWLLVNHIGFDADAFELFDVSTNLTGNNLTLTGNLGYGWGFDHLGAEDARLSETRIGNFSFQTTVVPLPAAVWLFASGLAGLFVTSRARRKCVAL